MKVTKFEKKVDYQFSKGEFVEGYEYGFSVEINESALGVLSFSGKRLEGRKKYQGEIQLINGSCSHIYRNGEYFLPWQICKALTSQGDWKNCWLRNTEEKSVIKELLKMKQMEESGRLNEASAYAERLTSESSSNSVRV